MSGWVYAVVADWTKEDKRRAGQSTKAGYTLQHASWRNTLYQYQQPQHTKEVVQRFHVSACLRERKSKRGVGGEGNGLPCSFRTCQGRPIFPLPISPEVTDSFQYNCWDRLFFLYFLNFFCLWPYGRAAIQTLWWRITCANRFNSFCCCCCCCHFYRKHSRFAFRNIMSWQSPCWTTTRTKTSSSASQETPPTKYTPRFANCSRLGSNPKNLLPRLKAKVKPRCIISPIV